MSEKSPAKSKKSNIQKQKRKSKNTAPKRLTLAEDRFLDANWNAELSSLSPDDQAKLLALREKQDAYRATLPPHFLAGFAAVDALKTAYKTVKE